MLRAALLSAAVLVFAAPAAMAQEDPAPAAGTAAGDAPGKLSFARPWELVQVTGPVFWPLLVCSLLTITFALERLIALRRRRVLPASFLRRFKRRLDAGELDRASAMELCRTNGSPIATLMLAAVRLWGRPTVELQKAVAEAGQFQILSLRRNLRIFQGIANVATLLGLLGTVLGMIHSFNGVKDLRGVGRGEMLANGIAQALVATAFGLVVAIPAACLYTFFSSRVERLLYDLDEQANDVIDAVSAESLALPARSATGPRLDASSRPGKGVVG